MHSLISCPKPIIYALVILSLITGCKGSAGKKIPDSGITVTDFRGEQLTFSQPAGKIVCLIESALSGIYMLRAQERIIAVPSDVYRNTVFQYYAKLDTRIAKRVAR